VALMAWAGADHYVFESTGGYERMAAWMVMAADGTASIVNPARVRHFALGMGQIAKTDPIDAWMIHDFALHTDPKPSKKPSSAQRRLTALVDRRQQLNDMHTAETNRMGTADEPEQRRLILQHLKWLARQLEKISAKIAESIAEDKVTKEKSRRIQSIKGLGAVSAATLLAHLPEIGTLSRREIASLVGLAPFNRDSGGKSGRRHICGGRRRLRSCLYMAAMSAKRHNPVMREFYNRLVEENHRPKMVALTAVMRKLVIAANSAVKNPDFSVVV
jgi:transposase